MVKTTSTMLALGTVAPHFVLEDVVTGRRFSLADQPAHVATVIMFICNHCPYVKHINTGIVSVAKDYLSKNIQFIAINSNDSTQYPDDSPAKMKQVAASLAYPFPYLFDDTQEVAKAYHAACTPDFFVFNQQHVLVYRGQFDDSRPGSGLPVTGESIREALDCLLANQPVSTVQKPSLGCNIKFREQI